MRVTVEKKDLNLATLRTQGAISDRSLAQLSLKAENGVFNLSVADRVLVIYSALEGQVDEPGNITVPARIFSDVVRELPDGQIELKTQESFLVITAGQNNEFVMKLPLIEDNHWKEPPVINSENFADLPCDKISYTINQVLFCVANESPRNYGNVGYLHKTDKGKLRLVGTDGYRLSYSEVSVDLPDSFLASGVCLSKRALNELLRMCGEGFETIRIAIADDQSTLVAMAPQYQIFVRLSAVKYPNYQGVLPTANLSHVKVSRPYIQSVAKRVLLASDKSKALHLCFTNSALTLRSRTVGSSEGHESLPISDYKNGPKDLAINGKFLTDAFSTIASDEVTINFRSEDDPVVLIPQSEPMDCHSMHVLVPIRES